MLEASPLRNNSDDFVFDNQMLAQAIFQEFRIGEVSCPARYSTESSSINFPRSVIYGLGVLRTSVQFRLQRWRLASFPVFSHATAARLASKREKGGSNREAD